MDANFRLKNRLRTTTKLDTTLGPGWAYFVQQAPYVDYIKNYVDQEEVSLSASHCFYITHWTFNRSEPVSVFRRYWACSPRDQRG